MSIKFVFIIISSILGILCFVPYLRDIFRGTTKPHSYSWFIWGILQGIGVITMFQSGSGIGGIMSLSIGTILCSFIFFLSLKYGTHNIKTFDKICLVGALIALAVYFFLHNMLLSILVVTLTDFTGFLPTFRKAYEEPDTETVAHYILSSTSSIFALGALSNFTFITLVYLSMLILANGTCATLILVRRKKLKMAKI